MDSLNEFLDDINARIAIKLPYPTVEFYREAKLHEKNEQTYPVVLDGNGKAKQISPSSKKSLICYHRVIDSNIEVDPERGYGKYPYRIKIYDVRSVWIGYRSLLPSKTFDSNDGILNEVSKAFPTMLTGKQWIYLTNQEGNRDFVFQEEYEGHNFSNLSTDVFAFYIEYQIKAKIRNC